MVVIENPMTYEGALRGSKKDELELALKEEMDSIERKNTWIPTLLHPGVGHHPGQGDMEAKDK